MAEAPFQLPTNYVADPTVARPVSSGSVYFGLPDTDPEILGNRITVTVLQENGTRVPIAPASQPLQTGGGGVIIYQGSPVTVLIQDTYSVKVLDSLGAQKYYIPRQNETADQSTEGFVPVNGSFENETQTAGKPDNWTIVETASGTIATDTDSVHGLKSLKFTSVDATGAGTATSEKFDVYKNGNVSLTYGYKSSAADTLNKIDINWYSSADALISTSSILNEGAANPTVFMPATVSVTAPATAVRAEIVITGMDGAGTTTSGSSWFDYFLFVDNTPELQNKTLVNATGIIEDVASAALSGASTLIAGIPASKKVLIHISGMMVTNASISVDLQIGDSGGIETTGYNAFSNKSTSLSSFAIPSAYRLDASVSNDATTVWDGTILLYKATGNTWHVVADISVSGLGFGILKTVGTKTLTGDLDRVQVLVSAGAFSAGNIYVQRIG